MLSQFEPKPKISHKNQTGNKNRKLNKIKLGNVKHEIFEVVMINPNRIKSEAARQIIIKKLEKEQINENTRHFKHYFDNLFLFFANCQIFKAKYISHKEPIIFKSNPKI
jgi:hypothetical protein